MREENISGIYPEALHKVEKTEAALKQAKLEKEQAEHRIEILELSDYTERKNEDTDSPI